ncbi:MAG: DotH/IcmK family type IV secretion protein [Desulfovibrio sp.]|nr:DotH/IcmK family type IV secretion protein [Desulfovibrio sp.]
MSFMRSTLSESAPYLLGLALCAAACVPPFLPVHALAAQEVPVREAEAPRSLPVETSRQAPDAGAASPVSTEGPDRAGRSERVRLLDESIEQLLPLGEEEIRMYKRRRDDIEAAVEAEPARMATRTRQIRSDPGHRPEVVRLSGGYASTLVFQDATGAPWPVLSLILGSARAFSASQPGTERSASAVNDGGTAPEEGGAHSNIVTLVPLTNHASSNLTVMLDGAPYPVILHLKTESAARRDRTADALVVLRLDRPGPKAVQPRLVGRTPSPVTPPMLEVLHGRIPDGASRIPLSPEIPGVSCWEAGGVRYLRTVWPLVWPAWSATAQGEDVQVHVLPRTPTIVVSLDGEHKVLAAGRPEGREVFR